MTSPDTARRRVGTVLVTLQFALIAALGALAAPALIGGRVPAAAWAAASVGALLGLWALSSNRPGNFNIRPTPREGGQLVQSGPYRWVRHPMYTAVMAFGLACAWTDASLWGWLYGAALVVVLAAKATLEERWMLAAHAGYAAYRARTRRFLPGVF